MAMKQWQQQRQRRTVKYSPNSEIKVFVGKVNTHSGRVKSAEREREREGSRNTKMP